MINFLSMIHPSVQTKLKDLIRILKLHRVERAYLFGSVCTERFSIDSDVDFLISFDKKLRPMKRGALHLNLYDELEKILNRKVDLVTEDYLSNPYFVKVLNKTKTILYE